MSTNLKELADAELIASVDAMEAPLLELIAQLEAMSPMSVCNMPDEELHEELTHLEEGDWGDQEGYRQDRIDAIWAELILRGVA